MALLLRGSHGSQALSFDGQRLGVSVSRAVPATARPGPTSSGSRLDAPEAHASLGRWPCLFVSEFAWRARSSTSRIKRDTQASHPWKCDDVPAQVWRLAREHHGFAVPNTQMFGPGHCHIGDAAAPADV